MGTFTKPGSIFEMLNNGAAKHNIENGAPAAAVPQMSNMLCPTCGSDDAILIVNPGRGGIVCQNNSTHRWQDMGELRNLNPRTIKMAPKTVPRATEGTVQLNILVHHTLKDQLVQRFGNKLDVTMSALCGSLLDPDAYVVPGTEAAEISAVFGRTVKGSAALKGAIRELDKDRGDWKEKAETNAKAGNGGVVGTQLAPGQVVINLGPLIKEMKTKAEAQEISVEEMLGNLIYHAHQNQWF